MVLTLEIALRLSKILLKQKLIVISTICQEKLCFNIFKIPSVRYIVEYLGCRPQEVAFPTTRTNQTISSQPNQKKNIKQNKTTKTNKKTSIMI